MSKDERKLSFVLIKITLIGMVTLMTNEVYSSERQAPPMSEFSEGCEAQDMTKMLDKELLRAGRRERESRGLPENSNFEVTRFKKKSMTIFRDANHYRVDWSSPEPKTVAGFKFTNHIAMTCEGQMGCSSTRRLDINPMTSDFKFLFRDEKREGEVPSTGISVGKYSFRKHKEKTLENTAKHLTLARQENVRQNTMLVTGLSAQLLTGEVCSKGAIDRDGFCQLPWMEYANISGSGMHAFKIRIRMEIACVPPGPGIESECRINSDSVIHIPQDEDTECELDPPLIV